MKKLSILTITLLFTSIIIAQFKVPQKQSTYIHDYENLLTPEQKQSLNTQVTSITQKSSIEFAIVILNDLQGYTPQEAAMAIGRTWGVGKKETNNGIVYLLSPKIANARLEIGLGLEGDLPDIRTKEIGNDAIPFYKKGDWYDGISTVVSEIGQQLDPIFLQQKAAVEQAQKARSHKAFITFLQDSGFVIIMVGFVIFFIYYKKRNKKYNALKQQVQDFSDQVEKNYNNVLRNYGSLIDSELDEKHKSFKQNREALQKLEETVNSGHFKLDETAEKFTSLQRDMDLSPFLNILVMKSMQVSVSLASKNSVDIEASIKQLLNENKSILKVDFIQGLADAKSKTKILERYNALKALHDNIDKELTYNTPASTLYKHRIEDNRKTYEPKIQLLNNQIQLLTNGFEAQLKEKGLESFNYNDEDLEKVFTKLQQYKIYVISLLTTQIPDSSQFKDRVNKEEADRLRKEQEAKHKREEEEKEEKEEEEEEEEEEQRQNRFNASLISSSSTSSSSYGGGSFGGGGSDSTW